MPIASLVLLMTLPSLLQLNELQLQPDVEPKRNEDARANRLCVLMLDMMWWSQPAAQNLGESLLQRPL